jgi:hypothetical protein
MGAGAVLGDPKRAITQGPRVAVHYRVADNRFRILAARSGPHPARQIMPEEISRER